VANYGARDTRTRHNPPRANLHANRDARDALTRQNASHQRLRSEPSAHRTPKLATLQPTHTFVANYGALDARTRHDPPRTSLRGELRWAGRPNSAHFAHPHPPPPHGELRRAAHLNFPHPDQPPTARGITARREPRLPTPRSARGRVGIHGEQGDPQLPHPGPTAAGVGICGAGFGYRAVMSAREGGVSGWQGADSERGGRPKPAAPFIPPVWYRARPWDPPITNDAAWL
jgi:hypothetical protein